MRDDVDAYKPAYSISQDKAKNNEKIFKTDQGPSTYYITLGRGRGVDNLLYALYGGGGCISYCYITQPDFFHRDPTSWAIHEYGENNKNGLLTDADRNVC